MSPIPIESAEGGRWAYSSTPLPLPQFKMPRCHKHFFAGHKWWCRKCDAETERQFRGVAEAWWKVCATAPDLAATVHDATLTEGGATHGG